MRKYIGLGVVLCSIAVTFGVTPAAEPKGENATRETVSEALQREAYGLVTERNDLLQAAIEADPPAAVPRWYLGQVQTSAGTWVASAKPGDARAVQIHSEYSAVRATKADDAQGQKALADWCADRGLKQQERVHLLRSLSFNPKQAEVSKRLGLVKVGQQWYEPATLEQLQQRARDLRDATAHWQPIFTRLGLQLSSKTEAKRAAAEEEILSLKDPLALPALQTLVGFQSDEAQRLVIRVCDRLPDLMATEMLAWHSVTLESPRLRKLAAEGLAKRELSDFVPLLIAEMYTPVSAHVEVVHSGPRGVGLRSSFLRETIDHHQLLVKDTVLRPGTFVVGRGYLPSVPPSAQDPRSSVVRQIAITEVAVERQNRLTAERNERIAEALTTATDVHLLPQPEPWWQWWMDLNEWTMPKGKGLAGHYEANAVSDQQWVQPRRMSCLIAGTPISTDQGLVAVERLKAGDLVLARDIATGELAYKPVIHTTLRPKKQLLRITAGKDVFEATGGHLFWVSGQGWVRARELKSGDVLHAAGNPVTVLSVEEGGVAETHNLVVADFANYFVGQGQMLSYDNTARRPTRMVVPGLPVE